MRVGLCSGVELHWVEQGRGTPVLLLHGGMGDCDSWAAQMRALGDGWRVIAYSRRCSSPNRNPIDPAHSIEHDIADLHALLQHLQTGPAHLVGTSYGACVALAFALRHRSQVTSLVLAEPPLHRWACRTAEGQALFDAFVERAWRPAAEAFAQGDKRRALQLLSDGIWGRPVFDNWPAARVAGALRNAAAMQAQLRSAVAFADVPRRAVAQLAMPVMLLSGSATSALHRCVVDELARELPEARRVVIDGAGHASPLEQPGAFNAALQTFLHGIAAAPPQ